LLAAADEATGGGIGRALAAAEFKGKRGQTVTILAPGAGLSRVIAVGLGKLDGIAARQLEDAGGQAAAALAREAGASISAVGLSGQQAGHVAMGLALRSYRFDRYRTTEKPEDKPKLARATVLTTELPKARDAWADLKAVAEGVFLSRDLVSEPANVLNPAEMAERCRKLTALGLKVEVFGPKEMTKLGFGALMGVAMGSANEPRMVVMTWNGASAGGKGKAKPAAKPLAFIGKGVTFDTGGISIKPAGGMEDMKWDMGGAGTVIGLMAALAGRKAKVDVIGLVGLVENMPSGTAQRPGDVVKSYSGQTIEVTNTDAEGRLILADALTYCARKGATRIVDMATLTGAIVVAIGDVYAGLFGSDPAFTELVREAGDETGDLCWPMPLHPGYDPLVKSAVADLSNSAKKRQAGAVYAARFLRDFTEGRPWCHVDVAGTAMQGDYASGFGVRLAADVAQRVARLR
jgi:leucyl aminopeptidase